tara:strand:- start:3012 stop:3455 length:444 start_codon:yes stop_codon:yes gene_type:complete
MDHWGFIWKEELVSFLEQQGHQLVDKGAYQHDPNDDYPDFVVLVARAVASGEVSRGIVVCGSGVGASIAANKVAGVRSAMCHDSYSAHQGVEHDDMNVLAIGSRIVGIELAKELVEAFLSANYTGDARHQRRLDKVKAIEAEGFKLA